MLPVVLILVVLDLSHFVFSCLAFCWLFFCASNPQSVENRDSVGHSVEPTLTPFWTHAEFTFLEFGRFAAFVQLP